MDVLMDVMSDPLVSTAWLAERLGSNEIAIVDATWFMPGDGKLGRDAYLAGHIPGAVHFDIDEIADHAIDLPHMLPSDAAFAEAAGALGLRRDLTAIVYDAQGIFSAPRVWWTLRTMGFPEVFVLDGGLKAWKAEGRPLETTLPRPAPTTIEPAFDPSLVRDLESVRSALDGKGVQVIDARPAARFRGETAEPRAGLRSGHMPGALNVPFGGLLNPDGTMKAGDELRAAFQAAGVDLDKPTITTCGSGVSAAILALALARLGRDDVAVYDGSWTEWGGRADTPVVTGS
jgi:thiosulfate/3-mercaptopyruvate sulfurtransferase